MSKAGKDLIKALEEANEFSKGNNKRVKLHFVPDVKKIRTKQRMSQSIFAKTFHLSVNNIRNWEQGKRIPGDAAKVLLLVIDKNPEVVIDALEGM